MSKSRMLADSLKIEKIAIGNFSFDSVLASDLYMYLDSRLSFDSWIVIVTSELKRAKDYFELYSNEKRKSFYVFSVDAAKQLLSLDDSEPAQKILKYLDSYDHNKNVLAFDNVLLSDHEKYNLIQEFSQKIGCDDRPIPLPAETILALCETIQLFKLQVDQMKKRLDRIDVSEISRTIK